MKKTKPETFMHCIWQHLNLYVVSTNLHRFTTILTSRKFSLSKSRILSFCQSTKPKKWIPCLLCFCA